MTWSEDVHGRHVQTIYRPLRPDGRFEPTKEPDSSDLIPVFAVAGVLLCACFSTTTLQPKQDPAAGR